MRFSSFIPGLVILLSLIMPDPGSAQDRQNLQQEILRLDSILFHEGFNKCELEAMQKIIHDSLVFYHDQSGITRGRSSYTKGIRENICSIRYRSERRLQSHSTEIHPLYEGGNIYAVIQTGMHDFYALEADRWFLTSTARFNNTWVKEGNQWLLKHVQSFDHKEPRANMKIQIDSEAITNLLEKHKVPALAMSHLRGGKVVQAQVFGELYEDKKASLDAIFNVASLTKPVVAMVVLELVSSGSWDLDEPLYHYYTDPDLEEDPRAKLLTTRHILKHQTGFPNWRWENEDGKLAFNYQPGTGYGYSGEGFEYLKHALRARFRTSLQQLTDSLLFKPLGMEHTRFSWDASVDQGKFAAWHDEQGENSYETDKHVSESAADNLLTTIKDYSLFAEYVIDQIRNGGPLYEEMVNPEGSPGPMGLGWEIIPSLGDGQYAVLHTGGDKGVHTLIMLLPGTGEGLIVFTNSDNGNKLYFDLVGSCLSLGDEINKGG